VPNITVRNLPDDVHELLQQAAVRHGRSLNQELLHILDGEAQMAGRGLEISHEILEPSRLQLAPQRAGRKLGSSGVYVRATNRDRARSRSRLIR